MASSCSTSAEPTPPWQELPREITAAILHNLGPVEMLTTAQRVCTTWRNVCRDPSMWRRIDIRGADDIWLPFNPDKIYRHAVDLSSGQLIDINIKYFGSDDLLLYISQRSSKLKRLQLVYCNSITDEGLIEAIKNFPLLEELHLYYTCIRPETIATVGRSCRLLKSFKLNSHWDKHMVSDMEVLEIAENMSGLCHLQLTGNPMTDEGLKAISEGCPNLESLDLRRCFNVRLSGDLGRLWSERIRDFKLPRDSIDDYEFPDEIYDYETSGDGYEPGLSDIDVVSDYEDYLEYSGDEYGDEYDYEDDFFCFFQP